MVASPGDLDSLDVEHETTSLQAALADLEDAGRVQLSWVQGQTWWDLQDALDRDRWHIFHFIGHGGFDERQPGRVFLPSPAEDGEVHRLGASDLARCWPSTFVAAGGAQLLRHRPGHATDRFSSTASVLMRRGIPAVVAMQYEISDHAAIAFAEASTPPSPPNTPSIKPSPEPAEDQTRSAEHPGVGHPGALPPLPTGALFDLTDVSSTPPDVLPTGQLNID